MKLRLMRYHFSGLRDQFMLAEDTYKGWVYLAVQKGRFTYELVCEGRTVSEGEAGFGEMVFCPPGGTLKRRALEPVAFHFAEFQAELTGIEPGKWAFQDVQRISSTFAYLRRLMSQPHEEYREELEHYIADLLLVAKRERRNAWNQQKKRDPLMHEANAWIEAHACEASFSLQELASQLRINSSQLTRRFQAAFGCSPIDYVTEARLHLARTLLIETNETLEQIAERCGYQNAFYFSRIFSKKMKVSPSVFRKTHRV